MKDSILLTKSKAFALRVVRLYKYLRERKESVIAKQMLRSGTSIGANIAESRYAQSKTDFASKLQIALDTLLQRIVLRMFCPKRMVEPRTTRRRTWRFCLICGSLQCQGSI